MLKTHSILEGSLSFEREDVKQNKYEETESATVVVVQFVKVLNLLCISFLSVNRGTPRA